MKDDNVIELYDKERYCKSEQCRRVDCPHHCWSCGQDHDVSVFPFCPACEIDLNSYGSEDLFGWWDWSEDMPAFAFPPNIVQMVHSTLSFDDEIDEAEEWIKENDNKKV